MGVYGWMIAALGVLLMLVLIMALVQAGTGISPDEEARILAEERRRRELEKEVRGREKRRRSKGAG